MVQAEQEKFIQITKFLQIHAEEIYDSATKKYADFLHNKNLPKKKLKIHKNQAIRVITALASNLENSEQRTNVLEQVGEQIAKQFIAHNVALEEAIDGIILLKQAIWQELEQAGFLYTLTVQEFYMLSSLITTYCDSITSKVALAYHDYYDKAETNNSYAATLTENIIDAVISTDNEYKIVSWNKGAEVLYGWSAKEVQGRYAVEVLNTEILNNPDGTKEVQEAVAKHGLWKGEAVQTRKDGTEIAVLAFISAVKDSKDNIIGTVAVNRDITERKRNEMDAAFLATMSERIRLSTDADELMKEITQLTGEYLHVTRCYLAEVFGDEDLWTIKRDYHTTLPSIAGEYRLSDYDTEVIRMIMAGRTRVAEDAKIDPLTRHHYKTSYEPIGVRAFITVPCRRNGHTAAFMTVFVDTPRQWHTREISLLETVAERLWNGIEKLRSEQDLRVSKEKYETLFQSIDEGFCIVESIFDQHNIPLDYQFLESNAAFERHTGLKNPNGRKMLELEPNIEYFWIKTYGAIALTGEPTHFQNYVAAWQRWFDVYAFRIGKPEEHKVAILFNDISASKRSEEALQKATIQQEVTLALLESLLKNAPIGFAFLDQEHRYIRINESLAELNGIAAQDHIGKTIEELLPENAKTVGPVLDRVMKTQEPVLDLEVMGETPKEPGVTRYWLTGFYPVFIGRSTDVNFVGAVVIEITAMKRLEHQKDEFLAVASHELKTPVTSIKAYAQVLQKLFKNKGDMQSVEFLAKMDAQINKLITLIADLLDVSKIQAGKLQLRLNEFDFADLVTEVVDEIQRTASHHIIHTQLAKNTRIYGDRDRIGQVITNLLTNAVKYSPNADRVIVQTHVDQETITVSVQDFGLGIPKEKQAKVFERFYRVQGSKENTYPGLGLGLYISSEIISRHGGTIWLESVEGQGSTFCFTLPTQKRILQQENALDEEVILHE